MRATNRIKDMRIRRKWGKRFSLIESFDSPKARRRRKKNHLACWHETNHLLSHTECRKSTLSLVIYAGPCLSCARRI